MKIVPNWLRTIPQKWLRKKRFWIVLVASIWYYFCLPHPLFDTPYATVVFDRDQNLLGAKIAADGQWRFPNIDSIPDKYEKALLVYEDAHFYQHPGINPVSIAKAFWSNIKAGEIRRGGSTISQQVIRLARKQPKRTYWEKFKEMILATRLEFAYSKKDILSLYASQAPFGGNVVGLEMASWRYFGRDAHQLTWAESATLAVLPNAPSLIFPGKNQAILKEKRNFVLQKLYTTGHLDSLDYQLSLAEALPKKPFPLPQRSAHLVEKLRKEHPGQKLFTTIDGDLQDQLQRITKKHHAQLSQNEIHNLAILVMDVPSRQVEAYIGNTPTDAAHEKDVNMIHALRSTGSILKPMLYAALLDAGTILPQSLVADVPTIIAGYQPENYDKQFTGAIAADAALARSLNIPAVRLLQDFGLQKFKHQLDQLQLKGIDKSVDHYGLTLILGGAESNLWDICKAYAYMAASCTQYSQHSSTYIPNQLQQPLLLQSDSITWQSAQTEKNLWDAASMYFSFEAMKNVQRPEADSNWEHYASSKTIAWKTGTSFGNKDAWSIGLTPDKVIGVWVGNADGEGRPNMTGVSAAAPILFEVLDLLPKSQWFAPPLDAMIETSICQASGHLAGPYCEAKNSWIPQAGVNSTVCPYHLPISTNLSGNLRVNSSCRPLEERKTTNWFVLPPLMEHYYKKRHSTYKKLPPFAANCREENPQNPMRFIYPKAGTAITLAKNTNGEYGFVLKLAHSNPTLEVFWFLNEEFIGSTKDFHELTISPHAGKHRVTVTDTNGNRLELPFRVE
ncbi:MAG: penicillin-binding protein 1C [Flavobacteriaceae bacterium]|nr:penicillin-binding protein 1C [Flavobacteriaceae bacterium]